MMLLAMCSVGGLAQFVGERRPEPPVREFKDTADEINYYLTEAGYMKTNGCVISPDQDRITRVRGLAVENRDLFLETAFNRLKTTPADKISNLLLALVHAGSESSRPLKDLLTPQNMNGVFASKSGAILKQLPLYLDYNADYAERVYILEALVALKYRPVVPNILRILNEESNPYLEEIMQALVDLDAAENLVEFLQTKIQEDLCNKNMFSVVNGIPVKNLLEAVEKLSKRSDPTVYPKFERIRQRLVLEPDEATLIRYANQGINERLRGTSVLLLAVSKSDAGMKVILEHLKNDPSKLVRSWSAQSLRIHQNPKEEVFNALIEAFRTETDAEVRTASLAALGQMDGKRFVPVIKEGLEDKNPMVRETTQRILDFIEKYSDQ